MEYLNVLPLDVPRRWWLSQYLELRCKSATIAVRQLLFQEQILYVVNHVIRTRPGKGATALHTERRYSVVDYSKTSRLTPYRRTTVAAPDHKTRTTLLAVNAWTPRRQRLHPTRYMAACAHEQHRRPPEKTHCLDDSRSNTLSVRACHSSSSSAIRSPLLRPIVSLTISESDGSANVAAVA